MINIKDKNVLIKTYLFESGLWYLALSLKKELELLGNKVKFIPKAKYIREGGSFHRTYPEVTKELSSSQFIAFNIQETVVQQINKAVKDFQADVIISFETLMQTAQWISILKSRNKIEIIDIPMPEWVGKQFLENNAYRGFDQVWALTHQTEELFKKNGYSNITKVEWDFVDSSLFYPPNFRNTEKVVFYHAGSLNSDWSSKNTYEIIEAYGNFLSEGINNTKLIISGSFKDSRLQQIIEKHSNNLIILDKLLTRQEIAELYRQADCILAPSTKEGLGLSFFEAKKCGCRLITTDAEPMKTHSQYLCQVTNLKYDESLIPHAIVSVDSIQEQIKKVYEDIMSDKSKTKEQIETENKTLQDALSAFEGSKTTTEIEKPKMDPSILAKLKAKSEQKPEQPKETEMPVLVDQKQVSINLAIIGVGQAGSRLAEQFHKLGYDVGVINTSAQDLKFVEVMENQKLLLEGTLGGTGKDLDLSRNIFESNRDIVNNFMAKVATGNEMIYLAVSGGGGTGAGSVDTLIPMMFDYGMPVGVIFVLPKQTEDSMSKRNAVETLARLAKMTREDLISNLIVVDNARIEQIYGGLSQADFWKASNSAIITPLHLFNKLTSQASSHTSLDPSDFGKIISAGDCSIYGMIEVENYMEETSLAEAVIESLGGSMLAEGFDLKQTRVGGVIITGSEKALSELPALNIDYCFHIVSEQTNGASIYRGIYSLPDSEAGDGIKIYAWFAGLGLPHDRIENLKKESKDQAAVAADKEKSRTSAMALDLDKDKVQTATEEIHRKIQSKKSGFSRLQSGAKQPAGGARQSIIDKRRG